MRAIYMKEPGDVSLIDIPKPEVREEDVLIRVHRVGLCGTDLQSYRGVAALTNFPLVPGHELGGEVESWEAPSPTGCSRRGTTSP